MKYAVLGSRILLGLIYTVFGLNFFFHFLPQPPLNEKAVSFIMALVNSGYAMNLVKVVEVSSGLLLLSGFYSPLALVLSAPITINIFLFHAFLAPENGGMIMPTVMVILSVILAIGFKKNYSGVLSQKPIE
ncbi:MAG: DoxX family protein [Leptospiraceae bacterium]|nr:DoxX family protein [Leptospiraceae bacterium]